MTQDRICCDKHVIMLPMCWMCIKFRFCGLLHWVAGLLTSKVLKMKAVQPF